MEIQNCRTEFERKLKLPTWLLYFISSAQLYSSFDHIFSQFFAKRIKLESCKIGWIFYPTKGRNKKFRCLIGSQWLMRKLPAMPNTARTGIMTASMMNEESSFKAFSSASPISSDLVNPECSNLRKCSQKIRWQPNCFYASSSYPFLLGMESSTTVH